MLLINSSNALTLLVRQQEGHQPPKRDDVLVVRTVSGFVRRKTDWDSLSDNNRSSQVNGF